MNDAEALWLEKIIVRATLDNQRIKMLENILDMARDRLIRHLETDPCAACSSTVERINEVLGADRSN
jgi:hypothetical protein